jgi:hypothetical protein
MLEELRKRKEISVTIENITPEMAEKFLESNVSNRKIRQHLVNTYAEDMKKGRWAFTHQGIAIDSKGELVDGQHRLKAIIDSGVAVKMVVARNVDPDCNIDVHARRTLMDITGWGQFKIGIARLILNKLNISMAERRVASSSEIKEFVEKHMDNIDFAESCLKTNKYGLRVVGVKAAFFAASLYEDQARLEEFADVFTSGRYANADEDSAAMVLREWLIGEIRFRSNPRLVYLRTERAIQQFCKREKVFKVGMPTEIIYPVS